MNCSQLCSLYCGGPDGACDNIDGSCVSGCSAGYQGDMCDSGEYTMNQKRLETY